MFEKNLNMGYLLDFYGEVLSEKKRNVLDWYYNGDLSLSEIAEEIGISRQGVRDIIKKTEEELLFYEERLGLAGKAKKAAESIKKAIEQLEKIEGAENVRGELESLAELLNKKGTHKYAFSEP